MNDIPLSDSICIAAADLVSVLRNNKTEIDSTRLDDACTLILAELLALLPLFEDGRPNRRLALELADLLDQEEAQQLYRFSVLVTKLGV